MGEYWNGIKFGTCNNLMYVRKEEIENEVKAGLGLTKDSGNLRLEEYLNTKHNFIYRFPFADEDNQTLKAAGQREPRNEKILLPTSLEIPHKDFAQVSLNSKRHGVRSKTFNLPFCPYSQKAADIGVKLINQSDIEIEISGQAVDENGDEYTIFECATCGSSFYFEEGEPDFSAAMEYLRSKANYIKYRLYEHDEKITVEMLRETYSRIKAKKIISA